MIMIGCDNFMSNYSMLLSWTLLTSASASKHRNQRQMNTIINKTKKAKGMDIATAKRDNTLIIIH